MKVIPTFRLWERTWWRLFQLFDFERTWWRLFQLFDFERTWWRLFQKRVVHTKFDIYVFIVLFVKTLMQYRNAVEWQRIQFFFFG
jgi:hypothetical protein